MAVGDAHFARTCQESGVLRQSICHYQKRRATYRDILERRARENQIDFVEGVATALLPVAFFEVVMTAFRTLVEDGTEVPPTRSASSPGWSDVLKLLVVVIVADKTGRFRLPPMVRVYVEMKTRDVAA